VNRVTIIAAVLVAAAILFMYLVLSGGTASKPGVLPKVLRLAIDTEPKTLDPIAITDTISDGVARKVHNALVRFEKNPKTNELEPVPDLAESFSLSPDGKKYTFRLRKGVQFHNGREVKAQDAAYSLTRLLTIESKRPDWIKPFVVGSEERYASQTADSPLGIRALDDYTLEIELGTPFTPFIQHLCTVNCAVVPQEAVEDKSKPFARNPIGTGAFKLVEWRNNEVLHFVRNDSYFKGKAKLDKIDFYILRDPNTRLEKFFGGELDASDIPYGRMKEALERAGEANVLTFNTFRTNYIGIGMPNGAFKDKTDVKPIGANKAVRQAMNYAIDREYLVNTVLEGRGTPACGVLPPGFPGFKDGRLGWPKNIDKAKELMKEAGHPNGEGLSPVTLLHRNDENTKKIAQAIEHDLSVIGVKLELQARDWNTFLEMTELEPRPLFLLGWVADYPDPDNFLYVLFHSAQAGSSGNHTWYSNPKVDELVAKARNLPEMKDRAPLYQQAESLILEDAPWICTYHVKNVVLLNEKVKGIRDHVTPLDTGTEFPQIDFVNVDIE